MAWTPGREGGCRVSPHAPVRWPGTCAGNVDDLTSGATRRSRPRPDMTPGPAETHASRARCAASGRHLRARAHPCLWHARVGDPERVLRAADQERRLGVCRKGRGDVIGRQDRGEPHSGVAAFRSPASSVRAERLADDEGPLCRLRALVQPVDGRLDERSRILRNGVVDMPVHGRDLPAGGRQNLARPEQHRVVHGVARTW